MIFDTTDRFHLYTAIHPLFGAAEAYIAGSAGTGLAEGRHEIDSSGMHTMVSRYAARPVEKCAIECHRRFIDIQMVTEGTERIGICPAPLCRATAYDESRDFQQLEGPLDFITLRPGLFAVFFPQDGHMPGVRAGEQGAAVRKIVIKVPVLPGA